MSAKRVVLSVQASRDVKEVTAWCRREGGAPLARRWISALQAALDQLGAHPQIGSARHAIELKLEGLRCWHARGFPYLIFYLEHAHRIDVGRVLHAQRDLPAWMHPAGPSDSP